MPEVGIAGLIEGLGGAGLEEGLGGLGELFGLGGEAAGAAADVSTLGAGALADTTAFAPAAGETATMFAPGLTDAALGSTVAGGAGAAFGDLAGLGGDVGTAATQGGGAVTDFLNNVGVGGATQPGAVDTSAFADSGAAANFTDPTSIPPTATPTAGVSPPGISAAGGVTSTGAPGALDVPSGLPATSGGTNLSLGGGAAGVSAPAGVTDSLDLTSLVGKGTDWVSNNPLNALGLATAGGLLGYNILQGNKTAPEIAPLQSMLATQQGTAANLNQQGNAMIAGAAPLQQQGVDLIKGAIDKAAPLQQQAFDTVANASKAGQPLIDTGTGYTQYLAKGTLPPDVQTQLDADTKAQKTALISRMAAQGMPTDPNKNSTLMDGLAQIDNQARVKAAQIQQQLLQGGTSLIGAGNQTISMAAGLGGQEAQIAGQAENAQVGGGGSIAQTAAQNTSAGVSLINSGANLTGMDNRLAVTIANLQAQQKANLGNAIAKFAAALVGPSLGKPTTTPNPATA